MQHSHIPLKNNHYILNNAKNYNTLNNCIQLDNCRFRTYCMSQTRCVCHINNLEMFLTLVTPTPNLYVEAWDLILQIPALAQTVQDRVIGHLNFNIIRCAVCMSY